MGSRPPPAPHEVPELYRVRARRRRDRALARCKTPEARYRAWSRFNNDILSIVGIERLLAWGETTGVDVKFDAIDNEAYKHGTSIHVDHRQPVGEQLVYLLHEAGHFLLDRSAKKAEKYAHGYLVWSDPRESKQYRHRVDVLHEELDAWFRGKNLARRLCIPIDWSEFERLKYACLKNYIKWILDPRGYHALTSPIDSP